MLRVPYSFTVALFGGRNWTVISALLLLIPTTALAFALSTPGTPVWVLYLVAALAGFGGGNFASSMANITFFFPAREKGAALGLNAAGGNIGGRLEELRWPQPTRPGDALRIETEILETRPSASRPGLGWLKVRNTTFNQKDEVVQSYVANVIVRSRSAAR